MKSYCIKTQNEEIIEYLLNKLSKLDFPNISYCKKSFKIYYNLIMHYKEEDTEKFENIVISLIIDVIIEFYENKLLKRIINSNYFYFDEFERKLILENCDEFLHQNEIREKIFYDLMDYVKEKRNLFLEGIVNFRVRTYISLLDNVVDMAVNKYIIEKEYKEFINLLKIYVNTTNSKTEIVHLIYTHGESILLDNEKNIIQIEGSINNAKYLSDISFSSNDIALNTLLSLLPQKIELHLIDKEDEFINTLKLIFENRIRVCTECNICKTYKMINKVNLNMK